MESHNQPGLGKTKTSSTKAKRHAPPLRPWINKEGGRISDDELRAVFEKWSTETWEIFLYETVDVSLSEGEVPFDGYWDLVDEAVETLWEFYGPLPIHIECQVRSSIERLEKIKRKIIRGHFWFDVSIRRLAARLGFSKSEVSRKKLSALREVASYLESDRATVSYLIGGSECLARRNQSRIEQIIEVYKKDLAGSFIK